MRRQIKDVFDSNQNATVCCALKGSLLGSSPRDAQARARFSGHLKSAARASELLSICRSIAIRRGLHTGAVLFDAHQSVGTVVIQNAMNAEA